MTKENLQILMKKIDDKKLPKHWNSFILKNVVSHNIILKYGKKAFCTYCQKFFEKNVNVNTFEKCPYCKNEYFIRNHNVKNRIFHKDIAFYSKVDGKIILRIYEIESKYNYKTKKFKYDLQEFARFIPSIGILINNTVSFHFWDKKVWHSVPIKDWHIYTGKKSLYNLPIYPYNKKKLFANTPVIYAPIEDFKRENPIYSDLEILNLASYESFELLWKMGLHRLARNPKSFNKKGSFTKRFGVPKKFLKFMIENNVDYKDYKLLKLLQKPDKELISKYRYYNYNYLLLMKKQGFLYDFDILDKFEWYFAELKEICKHTSLKKFFQYEKGIKNIKIYADYLKMATILGMNLKSKKKLFPYQLFAWHDKLCKKIYIINDMNTKFKAYLRYLDLSKYTFKDDKYIIFPAPSIEDLQDESVQQGNCVAYMYLNPYIENKTEIYFIRNLAEANKSLITLEFKKGRVVQKELPHHSINFTDEQNNFIDKWIGYRSFIEQKEKYKKKQKIKVIKYNFKKSAA